MLKLILFNIVYCSGGYNIHYSYKQYNIKRYNIIILNILVLIVRARLSIQYVFIIACSYTYYNDDVDDDVKSYLH